MLVPPRLPVPLVIGRAALVTTAAPRVAGVAVCRLAAAAASSCRRDTVEGLVGLETVSAEEMNVLQFGCRALP